MATATPNSRPPPRTRRAAALSRVLLRLPLFYKILLANVAVLVLGSAVGTLLAAMLVQAMPRRSPLQVVVPAVVVAVSLCTLVNAVILLVALSPLKLLERTAQRIHQGDLAARAPVSRLADADFIRLTGTFNRMLDSLASYRQGLRDIADRARRAEEDERKRIARELHDDTAQALAALLIRLRVARDAKDSATRDAQLEEVRSKMVETMEGIRRFARGLRPPALEEVGVVTAIAEHARSLSEMTGVQVEVEADHVDRQLSPDGELALYRILQEALSNAVRHAGAQTVRLRVQCANQNVVARVVDDGNGFVVADEAERRGGGLGLFGMQERAEYVGGSVTIESRVGEGTSVGVAIPVNQRDDGA